MLSMRNDCLTQHQYLVKISAYYETPEQIYLVGLGFTVLIWLGVIANGTVIRVFSQKSMRRAGMNLLLRALAISDLTYLLLFWINQIFLPLPSKMSSSLTNISYVTSAQNLGMFLTYPWMRCFYTASTWLLVIASFERFLAICYPFKPSFLHDTKVANGSIAIVILSAVSVNIPSFLQFYIDRNGTQLSLERRGPSLQRTVSQYYVILRAVMHFVVPFTLLIFCNTKVALAIKKMQQFHQTGISNVMRNEMKSTGTMFIAYGIMFIVCHTWPTGHYILETLFHSWYHYCVTLANLILRDLEHLLLIINASCSLVIYLVYGSRFRRMWLHLYCSRWKPEYAQPPSNRKTTVVESTTTKARKESDVGSTSDRTPRSIVRKCDQNLSPVLPLLREGNDDEMMSNRSS